jgi:D-galactarolactone cycloisomerase
MTIEKFEIRTLSATLDQPFGWSQRWTDSRGVTTIQLTDSDGVFGWGEAGPDPQTRAALEQLAPQVIGKKASHVRQVWQELFQVFYQSHGYAAAYVNALSAIDMALWDIAGKQAGKPAWELLGGQMRDAVPVYATGLYYLEDDYPDSLFAEASGYIEQGFSGMKMKIGGKTISEDIMRVHGLRAHLGDNPHLMVDANEGYDSTTALIVANQLADANLSWFEEPCPSYDDAANRRVQAGSPIPISGGESLKTRHEFASRLADRVFDIVQPDIAVAGGISEMQVIGQMANAFGVKMHPHFWGTGISFAASLHLVSTLPFSPPKMVPEPYVNEPVLEYDQTPHPVRENIMERFKVVDSRVTVPNTPGLGVEVDMDAVKSFTVGAVS